MGHAAQRLHIPTWWMKPVSLNFLMDWRIVQTFSVNLVVSSSSPTRRRPLIKSWWLDYQRVLDSTPVLQLADRATVSFNNRSLTKCTWTLALKSLVVVDQNQISSMVIPALLTQFIRVGCNCVQVRICYHISVINPDLTRFESTHTPGHRPTPWSLCRSVSFILIHKFC